jgi:hypothetical protein
MWILIIALLCTYVLFAVIEETKSWGGFMIVPLLFVILYTIYKEDAVTRFILEIEYLTLAIGFAIYTVAGAIWSFIKWGFFVKKKHNSYLDSIEIDKGMKGYDPIKQAKFEMPLARENKGEIIYYMSYWPVSFTYDLVFKGLVKYFKNIFNLLEKQYDAYGNWMIKK